VAADLAELRAMIEEALPGAEVDVSDETGAGDHLLATVAAPQFEGLSRIDQHRLVRAAVGERFEDGTIHALSIKTSIPPSSSARARSREPGDDAPSLPRSEEGG
jgi:stress-induced morphogen